MRAMTGFARMMTVSQLPAHIAQSVEHFLGKEEVTGSIPVVGSMGASPVEPFARGWPAAVMEKFRRVRDTLLIESRPDKVARPFD